jgi:hypothetical protein
VSTHTGWWHGHLCFHGHPKSPHLWADAKPHLFRPC